MPPLPNLGPKRLRRQKAGLARRWLFKSQLPMLFPQPVEGGAPEARAPGPGITGQCRMGNRLFLVQWVAGWAIVGFCWCSRVADRACRANVTDTFQSNHSVTTSSLPHPTRQTKPSRPSSAPLGSPTAPMDGRYSFLTVKEACESDKNLASALIVAISSNI